MSASVEVSRHEHGALVTLNRPEALNAIDHDLRERLITAMDELKRDRTVRTVVLTGAGARAFCAGQDLNEASQYTLDDIDRWLTRQHAMYQAVRDLDQPCIAALNGVATGAGFQLGLVSDLRVGYAELKLGQPEIKAGLASIVGSYLMTLHLGLSQNTQMSLSGELISGERAYQLGLLNHLVEREEVLPKALALAAQMACLAATATRLTKQRLRALTQPGFDAALEAAKAAQREAWLSGEPQAAMRSFLTRRK